MATPFACGDTYIGQQGSKSGPADKADQSDTTEKTVSGAKQSADVFEPPMWYATYSHASARDKKARNVVLFIGDGMGLSTVTAARIYAGQQLGLAGEEHRLAFEYFPQLALVKTYNSNQQVPDSAGSATALHSGVKTRAGLIGLAPAARRGDCSSADGAELESLLDLAEDRGMATGIVTNTRITHATPATLYAHSPERNWESDAVVPLFAKWLGCKDIASQPVNYNRGDGIDVVLGGGRAAFVSRDLGGERNGSAVNLLDDWQAARGHSTLRDAKALAAFVSKNSDTQRAGQAASQVVGLFSASHMTYAAERTALASEPDLPTMATSALALLQTREQGFLLVVEGGRIDHAHHEGKAGYALAQTATFATAIDRVLAQIDLNDTLVVVTADHSHTLTMGGYPTRGNPILGLVVANDARGEPKRSAELALDGKPYTTLGYQNGPGAYVPQRAVPSTGIAAVQQVLTSTLSPTSGKPAQAHGTHSGEDVALYAIGAGSARFGGLLDQEQVFHRILQAAQWRDD